MNASVNVGDLEPVQLDGHREAKLLFEIRALEESDKTDSAKIAKLDALKSESAYYERKENGSWRRLPLPSVRYVAPEYARAHKNVPEYSNNPGLVDEASGRTYAFFNVSSTYRTEHYQTV